MNFCGSSLSYNHVSKGAFATAPALDNGTHLQVFFLLDLEILFQGDDSKMIMNFISFYES